MKYIWTVTGRSGSGKDTLVDILISRHPEWKRVISKTTRPKRSETESYHIFTTEKEYYADCAKGIVVAHNVYNGFHYWATSDQIEEADFYIIDIPGLRELKIKYKGNKTVKSLGLQLNATEAAKRMKKRGDNDVDINRRLIIDNEEFSGLSSCMDVLLNCDQTTPEELAICVEAILQTYETLL